MTKEKETFTTWNNIASLYEEKFMDDQMYNETYDHFCESIKKGDADILELGCGPGNMTRYLLSKRPEFKILGTDIAPAMIERARINNPPAEFTVMDIRQIDTLTSQFDGIIGGFCLPYLHPVEVTELIKNAWNLLHFNGILYLSFVEGPAEKSGFKSGSGGRVYFHYHQLEALTKEFVGTGFDQLSVFRIDKPLSPNESETHTVIIGKKV